MRKYLLLILLITTLFITSCSTGRWIVDAGSEENLIKDLGYEKLYSSENMAICTLDDLQILNYEELGMNCGGPPDSSRAISVVGTTDEPTNILLIPELKKYDITTFDYVFPDREVIVDEVQTYINGSDNIDNDAELVLGQYYNLLPYSFPFHKDFYEEHDIGFPLLINIGISDKDDVRDSFIVVVHSDDIVRIHYLNRDTSYSELVYEFK